MKSNASRFWNTRYRRPTTPSTALVSVRTLATVSGNAGLGRVVVRVERPDGPLVDGPVKPGQADRVGAGGGVLDAPAQPVPRRVAR